MDQNLDNQDQGIALMHAEIVKTCIIEKWDNDKPDVEVPSNLSCSPSDNLDDGSVLLDDVPVIIENGVKCWDGKGGGHGNGELSELNLEEERPKSWKMSLTKATLTYLCQTIAGSDLSLPYAVSQGSIITLVALLFLPFLCSYTALILIKCMYKINPVTRQKERVRSTYGDLAEACWPRYGRRGMFFLHSTVLLLVSSLYLVLCGSFLTHAFQNLPLTKKMWTAIGAFVIMPLVFLKSLSKLAWASIVGIVSILIPIAVTLYYSFDKAGDWNINSVVFFKPEGIPVGLSIAIFTYGGHAILPRIEQGMKNPEKYNRVIMYNYILGAILKITIAFVPYLTFTSLTKQLITNNIPTGVLTVIISCSLGIKVLCSYPFLLYVLCKGVEDAISNQSCLNRFSPRVRYFCVRIVVILLTLCASLSIPQFGILIAFTGSIGASLLVFVLPGLFNLKLRYQEISLFEKVVDGCSVVFGICSCIFGLYFEFKALGAS